jgi:Putative Actinobacterial Holin-X, holin superfamily III
VTTDPTTNPTTTHPTTTHPTTTPAPGTPVPQADPAAAVPGLATPGGLPQNPDATRSIGNPTVSAPAPDAATSTGATRRREPADSSTGELLRTLTENVQSIVKGEVASARKEMTEKALAARPAAGMLGGAAVLGVLATGTSAVVLIRFLDKIFPPLTSAVVATGLLGGGAAVLARAGIEELRRIGPPVPERTIESVKADVAAVTEATPG